MSGRILVGTSSWADPGFVECWYPPRMAARDRLAWYAQSFEAVEVNATFYAVPDRTTVARWAHVTPDDFTFDVKLHRLLSRHSTNLEQLPPELRGSARTTERGRVIADPDLQREVCRAILHATEPLVEAGKMGAFLLQLTPSFAPGRRELDELEPVVDELGEHPIAVELRHRGWVERERAESTFGWLSERGLSFVSVDAPPGEHVPIMPPLDAVTNERVAYIRMHGRNTEGYLNGKTVAERFGWIYSDSELEEIAGRVRAMAERAAEVHVMFNNNRDDDAPTAAARFRALLGQDPGPAAGEQLRLG